MFWSFAALQFIIRWTVWELLRPITDEMDALRTWVKQQFALLLTQGGAAPGSSQTAGGGVEQVNFTTANGTADGYVGPTDAVAVLANAKILYRALGGEVLQLFELSGAIPLDGASPQVEIMRTTFARSTPTGFSTPAVLSIANPGSQDAQLSLNIKLSAGDCLIAATESIWSGIRVDGTIWVKKP